MKFEYRHVTLPVGPVPKSVGFDAVLTMELNEYAAHGWRVISSTRASGLMTPFSVLFERPIDD